MKKRLIIRIGKKERGFTLIELLIVIAILGVLAAVVVPNVMGLFGRGGSQAYGSDKQTIQTSVATFYGDVHAGPNAGEWQANGSTGHYFPTTSGSAVDITENLGVTDSQDNPRLDFGGGAVNNGNISAAAIWMGLLINEAAAVSATNDRGSAAPITGEESMYLTEFPSSCSATYNGNPASPGGTYTWIVGKNGKVYGAYLSGSTWYSGFSGNYP